ncbi:MAG: hypothetical protein HYZ29_11125 [Myxococcales bacterium]|nr:hypothetical protein [Myxococcales bacterium]
MLGICGWNDTGCGGGGPQPNGDNGVNVEPAHVDGLASGKPDDPIEVTRDNPWFQGWYSAPAGSWATALGKYSTTYDGSCGGQGLGTLNLYEFAPRPHEVDDWHTPLRPVTGTQSTGVFGQTWLNWAVRTGNFVPGNDYAVTQQNCAGHTKTATWFRLASDVLVVPVILISWVHNAPVAGTLKQQDFGSRGRALLDFIPFHGDLTDTVPPGWNPKSSIDPTGEYEPPDDLWSRCGIQFQVVATLVFKRRSDNQTLNNCDQGHNHFAFQTERNELIAKALGPAAAGFIQKLQPAIASFGYLHCPWTGHAVVAEGVAEINRAPPGLHDVRAVPAHELGHVLGLYHEDDSPQNLMYGAGDPGTELLDDQCVTARGVATKFTERYRTYNQAIGRVAPDQTGLAP